MADKPMTPGRRYFLPMPGGPGDDKPKAPPAFPLPPGAAEQIAARDQARAAAKTEAPVEVDSVVTVKPPASKDPFKPLGGSKTSAPSEARRTAPKVSADVYSGWKDRVDDNEYAYARSPTGDEFVILRAPADKQHLVGAKLSPNTVVGSPRLQRSYDAIKAKVEENLPAAKAWEDAADKMQKPKPATPVDEAAETALPGAKGEAAPSTRPRPLDKLRKAMAGSNLMGM